MNPKIVVELMPTLIGLMVGIGVMRSSGVFDIFVKVINQKMLYR